MAFVYYYRESIGEKLHLLLPYLVFLIAIKNSGALFAALILLYVFLLLRPEGNAQMLKRWALVCLATGMTLILWKKHVAQVFLYGQSTPHAMSVSNYRLILREKTMGNMIATVSDFVKAVFSGGAENWLFALTAVPLLWVPDGKGKKGRPGVSLAALALMSYGIYMLGMLGMYLFSMSYAEANSLAGYGRYHRTILIFVWGLLLMAFAQWQPEAAPGRKIAPKALAGGAIVLALMTCSARPNFSQYLRQDPSGTERARLERLLEENQVPTGKTYLFLISDQWNNSGFLYYLPGYLLESNDIAFRTPTTAEEADLLLYEYVILWEDTPECQQYWQAHFPDNLGPVAENSWEQVWQERLLSGFYMGD